MKIAQFHTPLTVAIILGLNPRQVVAMDKVLKPSRLDNGHRIYSPKVVERVRKERDRKAKTAARRALRGR